MPSDKLVEIEKNTTEQQNSSMWQSVHKYRITTSRFGEIRH